MLAQGELPLKDLIVTARSSTAEPAGRQLQGGNTPLGSLGSRRTSAQPSALLCWHTLPEKSGLSARTPPPARTRQQAKTLAPRTTAPCESTTTVGKGCPWWTGQEAAAAARVRTARLAKGSEPTFGSTRKNTKIFLWPGLLGSCSLKGDTLCCMLLLKARQRPSTVSTSPMNSFITEPSVSPYCCRTPSEGGQC